MTDKYHSNDALPASLRKELSPAKQTAYRHAYNSAWETYSRDEEANARGAGAETRAQVAHEAGLKAAKAG